MPSVDVTNWWVGLKITERGINNQVRARELSGNVKQRSFLQQRRHTIRNGDRDHKTPSLASVEIFCRDCFFFPTCISPERLIADSNPVFFKERNIWLLPEILCWWIFQWNFHWRMFSIRKSSTTSIGMILLVYKTCFVVVAEWLDEESCPEIGVLPCHSFVCVKLFTADAYK